MQKLRVYVGCGLTHAPKKYKKDIVDFKEKLGTIPWIMVLEFVTPTSVLPDPDPLHIYTNDIHACVGTAHAMLAELSYPSTGLGHELGTAIEKHGIRTLMCARKDALISHLPQGAPLHERNKHVSLRYYESSIMELF
jgi:hypothetical protein